MVPVEFGRIATLPFEHGATAAVCRRGRSHEENSSKYGVLAAFEMTKEDFTTLFSTLGSRTSKVCDFAVEFPGIWVKYSDSSW